MITDHTCLVDNSTCTGSSIENTVIEEEMSPESRAHRLASCPEGQCKNPANEAAKSAFQLFYCSVIFSL